MALLKKPLILQIELSDETIENQKIFNTSFTKPSITNIRVDSQEVACQSDLEKLQVLGSGSEGIVYKVRDKQTSIIYALKIVRVVILIKNMKSIVQSALLLLFVARASLRKP